MAMSVFILPETQAQTKADNKTVTPTITVTKLDISDKILNLSYGIRNELEQDIWICEDITVFQNEFDFETYLSEDNQTLLVRRRLDVPEKGLSLYAPPHGRYVRLRTGEERNEFLSLTVPVYPRRVFQGGGAKLNETIIAKRLVVEIGCVCKSWKV